MVKKIIGKPVVPKLPEVPKTDKEKAKEYLINWFYNLPETLAVGEDKISKDRPAFCFIHLVGKRVLTPKEYLDEVLDETPLGQVILSAVINRMKYEGEI